ncbi:hypothetical protein CO692_01815 [Enterococcus sp. FDAARGOS_375]|nr:hypothetical protein CO692_01815 [Enterococcus sp. FDAARGOS_375]
MVVEEKLMKRILFTGYFGAGNFGDDLMLSVFCNNIENENKLYFLKIFPQNITVDIPDFVKVIDISMYGSKVQKVIYGLIMTRMHMFFWIGGTIFTEHDGDGAYSFVKIAKLLKKKYGYLGVGIGQIHSEKRIYRSNYAIQNANFITFRDKNSYEIGKRLNHNVFLTQDLAYLYLEKKNIVKEKDQVIISWRELGKQLSLSEELNLIRILAISIIKSKLDFLKIKIIPLDDSNDYDKNLILYKELIDLSDHAENIEILCDLKADEKFDLIASSKINIMGRLHGVFVSEVYKRNTLSMSYSLKMDEFLKDLNKSEDNIYISDLNIETIDKILQTNNPISDYKIEQNIALAKENIFLFNSFVEGV